MPHTCADCGNTFTPARADAAYCSSACRQRAYRNRNAPSRNGSRSTASRNKRAVTDKAYPDYNTNDPMWAEMCQRMDEGKPAVPTALEALGLIHDHLDGVEDAVAAVVEWVQRDIREGELSGDDLDVAHMLVGSLRAMAREVGEALLPIARPAVDSRNAASVTEP